MNSFELLRAKTVNEAIAAAKSSSATDSGTRKFIAGGTNLVDLMRMRVENPAALIDISGLLLTEIKENANGSLAIGALVTNADLANHRIVRQEFPLLTRAILSGASAQIRNAATVGGNLLQRTRCNYFFDVDREMCNKRQPGTGCAALEGYNRQHAIFGASRACVAVHPSDMCVALAALEAIVLVADASGKTRRINFADFHRLPGKTPHIETDLQPGEIITGVELLASARRFAANSYYRKTRDRASYAFALVSVAAALEMRGEKTIKSVRIALGGVAHKPWRNLEVEKFLTGKTASDRIFQVAAGILLKDAAPLARNKFKIELVRRNLVRALELASKI